MGFWKIWNGGGCNSKTAAKMAVARIKLLRNKREAVMRQMRRDIALLLRSGQDATARIRVEHVIREQNVFAANEFIELFCELVVSRLSIIAKRRECPADLKEGIASLIFASPRCSEIPELVALRKIFEKKYGKDFVSAATDLRPNSGVNRLLIDKLSVRPPSGEVKLKVMKEIANIDNYIRGLLSYIYQIYLIYLSIILVPGLDHKLNTSNINHGLGILSGNSTALPCHIIPRSTLRGWIITLMVQGNPTDINHVYRRHSHIETMPKQMDGQNVSRRHSYPCSYATAKTLAHTPETSKTHRERQTDRPSKALNLTIEPTNRERRTLNFLLKHLQNNGRIQKLVREVYLRDDIYCGALFCKSCEDKSKARSTILVLDTNVVLNQIDLLENPAIEDVVLLSVVLQEVKNKNSSVYGRIRNLIDSPARRFVVFSNEFHRHTYVQTMAGESPNDRNDRAIRVAARWYQSHLGEAVKVLLITNDRENNRKATEEGVSAETIESYVKSLGHPALLDLLVQPASEDVTMEEVEDMRPSKRKVVYPEHKPCQRSLTKVIYHQGKLRVNRYNPFEAYVGSESIGDEIIIYGRGNMNRAFDGDVVAVELLPQDQWNEEKSRLVDPLTKDLRNMNALAKIMRQRRIQRGALTLASAEVKFQIDTETHDPLDIGMYQIREANQMVEEFMLAANVSVAEKEFPECSLLRENDRQTQCSSDQWPCPAGMQYYGRGPIQLTHNYNYGLAGQAIGVDLINNPDLVATEPVISFKTTIWFWMTPQANKSSSHDVIIGQLGSSDVDRAANRVPGYGVITNIINGGLECGSGANDKVADRIGFYKRYCDLLGIITGQRESHDCYQCSHFSHQEIHEAHNLNFLYTLQLFTMLLRNKREAVMRQMRRDIALLLRSGQDATARIRVEHVIREQNVFAANEFIELFCELVVSRLSIIAKRRECPADLKEGIASLIFASPRCSEIPELVALRKIFEKKYGKDFVSAATDLRPNSGVNRLIDLLENPAIEDVVLLSVVLQEVKNKNSSVYGRIRNLIDSPARRFVVFSNEFHRHTYVQTMAGESPNDRNDRVESYVKSLGQPALLDLLVQPASEDVTMEEVEDMRPSKRKVVYPEHKPMSEITSGLTKVIYHQGKLRVNRYNPFEAYVGSESIGDEIIIYGRGNMNRAFDGDVVAVELLPQDQWNEEKSLSIVDEDNEAEAIQRGALTLASAEVKFQIDTETHDL
uniref:Glycoside hydrolase family 19 catalytic domain-containing protein n=1 Tax=Salix viminalis TaxID=40686 RepID=A0A6N2ML02_SALVM